MQQSLADMVAVATASSATAPTAAGGAAPPRTPPASSAVRSAASASTSSTPTGPRRLQLAFKEAVHLGQTATATFDAGCLKSSLGGSNGELVIDDLPASAKEAGWSVDPLKLPLVVGDRKTVTVKYSAPKQAHAGMAAYLGHTEFVELTLGGWLKGGTPAPPSAEGRRVSLKLRCQVLPTPAPAPLA